MQEFDAQDFQQRLFNGETDFETLKAELWTFQLNHNPTLKAYCDRLGRTEPTWLPIEFFKHFEIKTGKWEPELLFESSGTTGQQPSRHLVRDRELYRESALAGFRHFFPTGAYRILALLPSYLERKNASLVHMVQQWIEDFGSAGSGFFLHDFDQLEASISDAKQSGDRILLIGVSFALMDFAEQRQVKLPPSAIVMETGGMKGRREELVREELHQRLKQGLGVSTIASEYGMTELLSQAYAVREGRFHCPPWMRVDICDIHLQTLMQPPGISGRILITDLANIYSCAFIATDDMGRKHKDGGFEVLGRLDHAEMRGCSLMYM